MKKLALLFALLLLLGCLTGCGGKKSEEEASVPTESIPYPGEFDAMLDENHCLADEHSMVVTQKTDPDCENYGEITHTCSICGWSYVERIEPTDHEYNPATCEFDAYCNHCQQIVETATGHSTTNGLCEFCGQWIEGEGAPQDSEVIE